MLITKKLNQNFKYGLEYCLFQHKQPCGTQDFKHLLKIAFIKLSLSLARDA